MSEFEPALKLVLYNEGGFVNNPYDVGGATNLGISLRFYRKKIKADATVDDIKNLTVNDAAAIYRQYFWNKQPFALIQNQTLANRVFDLSVNSGMFYGVSMLQEALNSLNPKTPVLPDGELGLKTLSAINEVDQQKLYDALIQRATRFYESVAMHDNNKIFLKGWLNRLNSQMV